MKTLGLELNPTAAAISAGKGHRMLSCRLAEVSLVEIGAGVDLLTLFQVVEHVPAPRDFLQQAVRLVRPGGFLVVAVPHEEGMFRWLPWDPANMPPHHVSRWRRCDLVRLGESCGLRVHSVSADVLFGRALETYFQLHNRLARRIGAPVRFGGNWLPRALSLAYRALGCRHYFPRKGLAVYAAFQKV
jgi:SAM-dependent methyltransferase